MDNGASWSASSRSPFALVDPVVADATSGGAGRGVASAIGAARGTPLALGPEALVDSVAVDATSGAPDRAAGLAIDVVLVMSESGVSAGVARSRKRSSSTGKGNTRVEFFSAATSTTVC